MMYGEGACRAAISLNNSGVRLLCRHQWMPAIETFKDAMKLMKSSVPGETYISPIHTQEILRRAWIRCEEQIALSDPIQRSLKIHPISSQCAPSKASSAVQECKQNSGNVLPITIDPIDFDSSERGSSTFESAVILYNLGLAYNCIYVTTLDSMSKTRIQHSAQSIFQLSESIVAKLHRDHCKRHAVLPSQMLLISMLLALTLMQSTFDLNPTISSGYSRYLDDFLVFINWHEDALPDLQRNLAPAA